MHWHNEILKREQVSPAPIFTNDKIMKTQLEKFDVCTECLCIDMIHSDCICAHSSYKTIELEFEICKCCGKPNDNHADTEFNKKQLKISK